jgi:hypothetical protein
MRRAGLVGVPDVQMINFGALSVFELANAKSGDSATPNLISYLRSETTRRLISFCVGAFTFGEAGLPKEPPSNDPLGVFSRSTAAQKARLRGSQPSLKTGASP